ncbi:MAG TPA: glycosyltransferase family 4 protein, partial [Coxiellaceae bacterium]|nr:glycosyltransferase family 4 protein [Coxiellaceae bacterium]
AGEGDDRTRLEQKAKDLGLSGRAIFMGLVNEAEKADIYRLANVFLMPGRGEGFGFVFLEALACGIPVIGSKVDGSREALLEGKLGCLVDPDQPQELIQAIKMQLQVEHVVPEALTCFSFAAFVKRVKLAVQKILLTQ